MLGKPEMHLEVHKVSVISNSIKYPTQKPLCSTDRQLIFWQLDSTLMILLTSDLFIPADLDVYCPFLHAWNHSLKWKTLPPLKSDFRGGQSPNFNVLLPKYVFFTCGTISISGKLENDHVFILLYILPYFVIV